MNDTHGIRLTRKGFTLIELLVVISIIALLLSIMMPSLRKAKEKAKSSLCQNNLKQLSLGFMMYLVSNNNKGPAASVSRYSPGYEPWIDQILPYMSDPGYASDPEGYTQKVMFCPSTKEAREPSGYSPGLPKYRWRYDISGRQIEGAYALNVWVGGGILTDYIPSSQPELFELSFRSNLGISGSAEIPVFSDCTWAEAIPLDTDEVPTRDISSSTVYADFWLPTINRYFINRHEMKINSSFADGHVDTIPLTKLWNQKWHKGFKKISEVPIPLAQ